MISNVEESRRSLLNLLEQTRRDTRSMLSGLDPLRLVHDDKRGWRVRDVVGHLAVWNEEAARSLSAYASGGEYTCIASSSQYDEYNGPAADERREWSLDEVWAEYEASHDQLEHVVAALPAGKWHGQMLFPWNESGTVEQLVTIMMRHEAIDHCDPIIKATSV